MIKLNKLAKKILEKKKNRLYGKSEWKPMKTLFKDPVFNAYMTQPRFASFLKEMPHADYGELAVDLRLEEYPISEEEKRQYLRQYQLGGLYGYVERYKKWLKISDGGIKAIKEPPTNKKAILPDYWEKYIRINM